MKNAMNFKLIFMLFTLAFTFYACSLDEELNDQVVGEANVAAGAANLAPVYSQLSAALQSQESVYALQMHSSDELIGPTRGTDWNDFGVWRSLHTHTWDATHVQVNRAWNDLHIGVTRANAAIKSFTTAGTPEATIDAARGRFLRAFMLWQLVDLFGSVPYRDENDTNFQEAPPVLSRSEGVALVISELEAIVPILPSKASTAYPLINKEAAWALLAKVYLNKFVYDGLDTAPSADMDKVIQYADNVINTGFYMLAPGDEYFTKNFGLNNHLSTETIFAIENKTGDNLGSVFGSRAHMTLHYNQQPSGWNGFTTIADFYNKWDQNDKRFKGEPTQQMKDNSGVTFGFLVGQQKDKSGANLTERNGSPLDFTVDIPISGASERRGVRVIKYEIDFENTATPGVDNPIIRYADVWLCKVEALWRKGQSANALTLLNQLRANRGVPDRVSIAANGQEILDERGFELYWEGHRRTDLIRFDQFNRAWDQKAETPEYTKLFPIPQAAVDINPNQQQNPGY